MRRLALALVSGVIGAGVVTGVLYATGAAGDQNQVTSVQELVPAGKGSDASTGLNAAGIYTAAAPGVVDITASGIRSIQAPDNFTIADAIQTDAAINPGNSGGPVLNPRGQAVGITDQIATGSSGSDSFSGVGFAVPIDDVKAELSKLEQGVQVTHAYLGIGISQTTGQDGALIGSVAASGPGAAAGLRSGDLVTAVDGKAIHGANGLVSAINARQPGNKLTLTVQRGSQHLRVTATLGKQPSQS